MTFLADLLHAAPTCRAQLSCGAIWTLIMFFYVKYGALLIVKPYLEKHPQKQQFVDLAQKLWKEGYYCDFDKDKAYNFSCQMVTWIFHHMISSFLCFPAVFGGVTPITAILARHGALMEVGWEVSDLLPRGYKFLFGNTDQKAENPPALMVIMICHHAMGMSLVMPMNIYFSENYWYFCLVCSLQAVAAVGLGCQQWGFLLDITTKSGLTKMKLFVLITLVSMWAGRLLAYIFFVYKILLDLHTFSIGFFWAGVAVSVLMMLLNALFLIDSVAKANKYFPMKLDEDMLTAVQGDGAPQAAGNTAWRSSEVSFGTSCKMQQPLLET